MSRLYYDPLLKQWLLRCPRCGELHTFIYETREGEFCERCLMDEERKAA